MIGMELSNAEEDVGNWIVACFQPNCAWELSWQDRGKSETAISALRGLFLGIELLAYGIGWTPTQTRPCRYAPVFFDNNRKPKRCKLFTELSEKEIDTFVLQKATQLWRALGGESVKLTLGNSKARALLEEALLTRDYFAILECQSLDVDLLRIE